MYVLYCVVQHHYSKGIHNFICGASGAEQRGGTGLYGGRSDNETIDWVGGADDIGFVAAEVGAERMVVRFIGEDLRVLKEVTVHKQQRQTVA